MEKPPIGEGSGEKRSQDRPPVLCKKRKPAVLRENSGLGYISNDSDQVPEEFFWSLVSRPSFPATLDTACDIHTTDIAAVTGTDRNGRPE
jgi:hypothetical protein